MARFLSRARILSRYIPAFMKLLFEDHGDIRLEDGTGHLMQE